MSQVEAILYSFAPEEVRPFLKKYGIRELPLSRKSKPQVVITYGGDGTFFNAERDWPGIPKVFLRRSRVCAKCLKQVPRRVLQDLGKKDWTLRQYPKVAFTMGLVESVATNDIILRNWNPNQALRFGFSYAKGCKVPKGEIIGDGLVLSTEFGAGAYYQSITGEKFKSNFGLAFNNPTKPIKPVEIDGDFIMEIEILREYGVLCLDNLPCFWFLRAGETFTVKRHKEFTRVFDLMHYYCKACQRELQTS
jgi:NAD kinase